jgi:DNA-binding beta-propeller fold protein YncE
MGLPASAADQLPLHQRTTQDGIAAELRIEAQREGPVPLDQALRITIALKDEASGEPLRGLRPRLWMSRQGSGEPVSCSDQVRRFAGGKLTQRADRDLNGFQFLTLNADANVSVINPQVQVGSTKLEALIPLPGAGSDWVYSSALDLLFVTLAERGELAVVDMARHRVRKTASLGATSLPRRLVLSRNGTTLWIALDGADSVLALDARTLERRTELRLGAGPHRMALTDDGFVLVASSGAKTLSVVDSASATLQGRFSLPAEPLALAYSALSRRAYVALVNSKDVAIVDPAAAQATQAMTLLGVGVAPDTLKADPSGRFVLGLSSRENRLVAIDTASGRLIGGATVAGTPDQIGFTRRFAYVRSGSSLNMNLLELDNLAQGKFALSSVPFFQRTSESAGPNPTGADVMVASPEGDSMVVGSPADTALYYYTEGMMAPQGSYRTYSRALHGLLVVDRSLRETAPGEYSLAVKLDRGGRYSLPLLVGQPRLIHCFALHVDEPAHTAEPGTTVRYRLAGAGAPAAAKPQVAARVDHTFDIELSEPASGKPLAGVNDLQVMALELPGLSQQRQFAVETGPGTYRVTQRFPRAGQWRLSVQSVSRGLSFDKAESLDLRVTEGVLGAQASRP